jgi:hypothetical protein
MTANTIVTISTSQSPDAKPVAISKTLTTNFSVLIEVPNFEIPELVFGGSTVEVPGVAEVITPLILSNKTANTAYVDIQVYRLLSYAEDPPTSAASVFSLATNIPVPGYDTIFFPMNGQFFYNGDILEAKADVNGAVDVTISYTLGQAEVFLQDS